MVNCGDLIIDTLISTGNSPTSKRTIASALHSFYSAASVDRAVHSLVRAGALQIAPKGRFCYYVVSPSAARTRAAFARVTNKLRIF